jgi:hypothetical protein
MSHRSSDDEDEVVEDEELVELLHPQDMNIHNRDDVNMYIAGGDFGADMMDFAHALLEPDDVEDGADMALAAVEEQVAHQELPVLVLPAPGAVAGIPALGVDAEDELLVDPVAPPALEDEGVLIEEEIEPRQGTSEFVLNTFAVPLGVKIVM